MKKPFMFSLAIIMALSSAMPLASAHCPLCTAAAGAGVAAARFYGVDDSVVGLFLGALIVSSALWFDRMLKKKIDWPFQQALLVIVSFLLLAVPFYQSDVITDFQMVKSMPAHHGITGLGVFGLSQFGFDKLMFGMIIGSLSVWAAFALSDYIKKKRGKVLWPYQGFSFMMIVLAILSLLFWLVIRG